MKERKKARRLLLDQHRSGQPLPVLVVTEVIRAADQHFRQIMPIEVTRFYLRPFFIIITFCLQKALDLKVSFCALQCLNSPRLLRRSTQGVQRDHFHCVAFFSPLYLNNPSFQREYESGHYYGTILTISATFVLMNKALLAHKVHTYKGLSVDNCIFSSQQS